MASYDTLGALIEGEFQITAYCHALDCRHYSELDLAALAKRLGLDFVAVGEPNPLVTKLRCQKCGGKDLSLRLSPEVNRRQVIGHGPFYPEMPVDRPAVKLRRARRKVRL